jgi:hypothetical protein
MSNATEAREQKTIKHTYANAKTRGEREKYGFKSNFEKERF